MAAKSPKTNPKPLGKAADAAGLVKYQAGTIVSRTLIQKPAGTITLFAFAAGQELSEHTAPFDALVQILDGQAEIVLSGKPMRVAAGQMVILPAGKSHAVKAVERFKMMLVMIREPKES